jgi:hypothetical protein
MLHFTKACGLLLLVLLLAHSLGGRANDDPLTVDAPIESAQTIPSNPASLVNYSWRILDSIIEPSAEPKRPCRHERCFREGDSILVMSHGIDEERLPCGRQLSLVMNDSSSGEIRPFYGINGAVAGCDEAVPTAVSLNFWDAGEDDPVCRKIEISPVRITESVEECERKLQDLSGLSDAEFRSLFLGSCDMRPLMHWRVSDDRGGCGDSDTVWSGLSPPEPGQGTGSGGSD